MSSLDNMKARINYNGGGNQQDRMNEDKLRSLKKAMLYSYQAATAILEDGREFRCLINPDKTKTEYRDKIISIPFADVKVGDTTTFTNPDTGEVIKTSNPKRPTGTMKMTEAIEPIGMKVGDTFEWKEDGTYWLVYLRYEEERAYFRAEIRNCDAEIEINGKKYRGYLRGPDGDETLWRTKHNISWVDIDYHAILYITNNEETKDYFYRFKKLKINDKPWEVQIVDAISNEGLIMVALKEDFSNELQDTIDKKKQEEDVKIEQTPIEPDFSPIEDEEPAPLIIGPAEVYPYDKKKYTIQNACDGSWIIDNTKKAIIAHQSKKTVTIDFITGRSGDVTLTYHRPTEDIVYKIHIASL